MTEHPSVLQIPTSVFVEVANAPATRSYLHRGAWSIEVTLRGADHAYAVRTAHGVINDLYLTLLERHPEYLIEHFGLSPE